MASSGGLGGWVSAHFGAVFPLFFLAGLTAIGAVFLAPVLGSQAGPLLGSPSGWFFSFAEYEVIVATGAAMFAVLQSGPRLGEPAEGRAPEVVLREAVEAAVERCGPEVASLGGTPTTNIPRG